MKRKISVTLLHIISAILSLVVVAPLLPGIDFHGGLLSGMIVGSIFYCYQRLWVRVSHYCFGIPKGSCPMPGMMPWVMLSATVGIVLFVGALGLVVPALYSVSGVLTSVVGGVAVTVSMMVLGIVVRVCESMLDKSGR